MCFLYTWAAQHEPRKETLIKQSQVNKTQAWKSIKHHHLQFIGGESRPRMELWLAQGHVANSWPSWDANAFLPLEVRGNLPAFSSLCWWSFLGPEGQLSSSNASVQPRTEESSLLSLPASQSDREVNAAIGRASMENLEAHSCRYSLGTSCPQSLHCWGVPLPFLEGSALGSEVWLWKVTWLQDMWLQARLRTEASARSCKVGMSVAIGREATLICRFPGALQWLRTGGME